MKTFKKGNNKINFRVIKHRGIIYLVVFLGIIGNMFSQKDFLIKRILTDEQQSRCGLNKLNEAEIAELDKIFSFITSMNSLGDSAVKYLEHEGWEEVRILGMRSLKLNYEPYPQDYLIAEKGATTYILEPRGSRLSRGTYLGKMGHSSCEIIDSSGDVARYRTAETR